MKEIRLQKYLSQCGVCSRRKAKRLILEGKVEVNERVITETGVKITPGKDKVRVEGIEVSQKEKGVVLFNKPAKVVSTLSDPQGRLSISHFIPAKFQGYFPVGRLDYESKGLVVLTNDGDLANFLLHPRYGSLRIYLVKVKGVFTKHLARKVKQGVKLKDGLVKANIEILKATSKTTWLKVSLTVGKNRVIRRLMKKLGFSVLTLERVAHGPFYLGDLEAGKIKKLPKKTYLKICKEIKNFYGPEISSTSSSVKPTLKLPANSDQGGAISL
ncbi:MAG: rRNA pseudouridine synthase [Candidatus Dadabacteria bacterium]|nr:MAG: rRNA pseudouridine synthase [Candidatus Dadabacteria bacterium]